MKKQINTLMAVVFIAFASVPVIPQSGGTFEIKKSVVAGGGGNSAGGPFVIDGTIGQSAAGTSSTGGEFQLTGGFWGGSAAPVSNVTVSGRVTTPTGLGLRNAIVAMVDQSGVRRLATTSSFGIYSFESVPVGQNYILSVSSKRFRFAPQTLQINGTLTNVNFTGLE